MFYNPANRLSPGSIAAQLPQNVSLPIVRHQLTPMHNPGVRQVEEAAIPAMLSRSPEGALARMMKSYGIT